MFNTKLLEVKEYANGNHNDSFSSGSDHEDHKSSGSYHRRKSQSPHRAIPHAHALTIEQKAKAGIFVVDPFHCRINIEFLKAFAQHHNTQPLYIKQSTYFTSSSEEDDGAVLDLAPDMSYMGFSTSSSSDDEHSNQNPQNFDFSDTPIHKAAKKSSRNGSSTSKKIKLNLPSAANPAKIVNSSSLPRPADNSEKFPLNLSPEIVEKLAAKVSSNYKSYPQNHRHGSTPMDISACPGIRLLTEDEYISCSLLRIRPALYFHARNTLLYNFHHSVGYFRKSAAQKMLRIDVNKTGKLYDFLVRQNWLPETEGGKSRPEPEQIIIDDPETYHQL